MCKARREFASIAFVAKYAFVNFAFHPDCPQEPDYREVKVLGLQTKLDNSYAEVPHFFTSGVKEAMVCFATCLHKGELHETFVNCNDFSVSRACGDSLPADGSEPHDNIAFFTDL